MIERNKQVLVGNKVIKIQPGIVFWQLEFILRKIRLPDPTSS